MGKGVKRVEGDWVYSFFLLYFLDAPDMVAVRRRIDVDLQCIA